MFDYSSNVFVIHGYMGVIADAATILYMLRFDFAVPQARSRICDPVGPGPVGGWYFILLLFLVVLRVGVCLCSPEFRCVR